MFVRARIERPEPWRKQQGEVDHIEVVLDRGLKSGKIDRIPVTELEAMELIVSLSNSIVVMRRNP